MPYNRHPLDNADPLTTSYHGSPLGKIDGREGLCRPVWNSIALGNVFESDEAAYQINDKQGTPSRNLVAVDETSHKRNTERARNLQNPSVTKYSRVTGMHHGQAPQSAIS